ncbi:16966_t:CDS:2 [Funneliformis geosporum]|uniref:16966_t:CDS:1 n=1 Tax=Funneliformis geosporum TaxID=1117311 RepID=A0A9W4SFP7_9GLOM|nr:16966_t:CDS:2 [Funneliformis geosporum]
MKIISSLHVVLIIFIIFHKTVCNAQYNALTHYEDPSKELYLFDSTTEKDGTLLIQFAHYYEQPLNICIYPDIHLRIVYSDGTVKPLEVAHQIPDSNFCSLQVVFKNIFVNKNMILLTYFDGQNENTSMHTGMVIDFDGNLLQYLQFGVGIGRINRSKNPENGFTWSRQVNATTIAWSRYIPDHTNPKQILKSASGLIKSPNPSSVIKSYKLFSSGNGGNVFVIVTKLNKTIASDPAWEVYADFVDEVANENSLTYLIYQSQVDYFNLSFMYCRNSNGEGCSCLMQVEMVIPNQAATTKIYYLLTFLSSGSVINNKQIDMGAASNEILSISVLFNGGFLVIYPSENGRKAGIFLSHNGDYEGEWKGFNGDVIQYTYLEHNDTLWGMLYQNSSSSWTIITEPLRDRSILEKYKYNNPNILETTPFDDVVRDNLDTITIKYDKDIIPSYGNISIYQIQDNYNELLRQTYSGLSSYVTIMNDTVGIKILSSTFNQLGATYFIQINDNFVDSKLYGEPITGINKRVWFLNASLDNPGSCQSPVTMLLRFNAKGSKLLRSLNTEEFDKFYDDLMMEFSKIIPVERSRLPPDSGKFQNDPYNPNNFILLQVKITQPTKKLIRCAKDIAKDVNAMIINKYSTLMSHYPLSSMLDENYGAKTTPDGWDDALKLSLFYVIGGFLFVTCIYFIVRSRNKEARNAFVLTFTVLVSDFVLDMIFIIYNSQMIYSLFIPSVVFLVIPTVFNMIFTLFIILKEQSTNKDFQNWFMSNTKYVAILTILSSANVGLLNIITSQIGGLSHFDAPLSEEAKVLIFWGSLVNIFIEDVPQFITRIIFLQYNSVIYDPVPVLSLISAGISIIFGLICRGYDVFVLEIPFDFSGTNNNQLMKSVKNVITNIFRSQNISPNNSNST